MIQNFTQAGKKYSVDIAKIGYTAGATHRPTENRNLQFKQNVSESLRHFDALHYWCRAISQKHSLQNTVNIRKLSNNSAKNMSKQEQNQDTFKFGSFPKQTYQTTLQLHRRPPT